MSKFAAMNASLLVRKGEAVPSTVTQLHDDRPMVELAANKACQPAFARSAPASDGKPRRLVLTLSARDFEGLGLAAVKRGVTRHVLAAEAMALYFEKLTRDYDCACIGGCRPVCAAE